MGSDAQCSGAYMTGEVDALRRDVDEVKGDLRGMREDIKDIAKAMRDLVRVDIDQRRLGAEQKELEKRIRVLETTMAGNTKSVNLFDWFVRYGGSAVIGAVITAIAMGGGLV